MKTHTKITHTHTYWRWYLKTTQQERLANPVESSLTWKQIGLWWINNCAANLHLNQSHPESHQVSVDLDCFRSLAVCSPKEFPPTFIGSTDPYFFHPTKMGSNLSTHLILFATDLGVCRRDQFRLLEEVIARLSIGTFFSEAVKVGIASCCHSGWWCYELHPVKRIHSILFTDWWMVMHFQRVAIGKASF